MLTAELAEAFLKRFIQYIPYQINIMNEKGIVIASSDKSRIGAFHEIAYKILKTDNLMILTEHDANNYIGVRYGVNSAVLYRGEKIGVVGLTGNPYEVRDMISLIRIALEQMLEYELGKNNDNYRGNLRTQFIHMLLYEDTAHTRSELSFLSSQLGYQADMKRIPILITCSMNPKHDYTNSLVQLCSGTSDQDIVIKLTIGQVLIFKSFPDMSDEALFEDYRKTIHAFLAPVLKEISDRSHSGEDSSCYCLIGTFQNRLTYYRSSYNHCLWLQNQLEDTTRLLACEDAPNHENTSIYYFYDNIGRYVKNITPLPEFHRIYNAVAENIDEEQTDRIIETLDTLQRHNYNMNSASQELGIHKNTLIFRFNKIKKNFNINPVQNVADREFIEYLVYYLNTPK
ncbi:MAG: sugar diacid recognition domain-containing protein [Lachnospiraceae bacterium]|nr:sugar diacid recognition domain-containing protein [Lachnospiraceae bacterium]